MVAVVTPAGMRAGWEACPNPAGMSEIRLERKCSILTCIGVGVVGCRMELVLRRLGGGGGH